MTPLNNSLKTLEKRIQHCEERYPLFEKILLHVPLGLIWIVEGKIVFFNGLAENFLGYRASAVLDCAWEDFFPDTLLGFSLKTKGTKIAFIELDCEGKKHALETTFIPVEQGALITLKERIDSRCVSMLNQNEKLKEVETMGARLAHEIRNPLSAIMGYTQLLHNDLHAMPEKRMLVDSIIEGSRLINRLVTQVLDYARPLTMHLAPHDLCTLIQETLRLAIATETEGRLFRFVSKVKSCLYTVDKDLLQMALLNLLKNGQEASPPLSTITITLQENNPGISLSVRDSGKGIAQEHIPKIFTPFFTTKARGTGLGLAEVHKIVKAHGGEIHVESGIEGSCFTLKI